MINDIICVMLAAELKDPDSQFKEFLDTFPKSYERFPLMYTNEEME